MLQWLHFQKQTFSLNYGFLHNQNILHIYKYIICIHAGTLVEHLSFSVKFEKLEIENEREKKREEKEKNTHYKLKYK